MKRTALTICLLILLSCALTACSCSHQWKEATCTEPETCRICGATKGDVLEHSIVEATYQRGQHCVNCGETFGEPILSEFVRTGKSYQTVDLTAAHGKMYTYVTGKNNFTQSSVCDVTVRWAVPMEPELGSHSTAIRCYVPEGVFPDVIHIANLYDLMENLDGYTWRGINAVMRFRASGTGNLIWGYEDYYNLAQYDQNGVQNLRDSGAMCTTAAFSVDMNGETYDQCQLVSIAFPEDSGVELHVFYRVPDGYDGCVLSCIDSRIYAGSSEEAVDGFTTYESIGHGVGDVYFRLR